MAQELGFEGDGHNSEDLNQMVVDKAVKERAAHFTLDGRQRGDGNIVQIGEVERSAIQTLLFAPKDDQYRLALLLSENLSPQDRVRAVNAISFCQRYGGDLTPIVDKIIAVAGATRLEAIVDIFTHMRITNTGATKRDRNHSKSPIS